MLSIETVFQGFSKPTNILTELRFAHRKSMEPRTGFEFETVKKAIKPREGPQFLLPTPSALRHQKRLKTAKKRL